MILINGVELRPFAHQTADDAIPEEYLDDILNDVVATSEDTGSHDETL